MRLAAHEKIVFSCCAMFFKSEYIPKCAPTFLVGAIERKRDAATNSIDPPQRSRAFNSVITLQNLRLDEARHISKTSRAGGNVSRMARSRNQGLDSLAYC